MAASTSTVAPRSTPSVLHLDYDSLDSEAIVDYFPEVAAVIETPSPALAHDHAVATSTQSNNNMSPEHAAQLESGATNVEDEERRRRTSSGAAAPTPASDSPSLDHTPTAAQAGEWELL